MFSTGHASVSRQGEPSVGLRIHQTVDDEGVECALALHRIGPDHVQCRSLDRIVRAAKHVEQQTADLAVSAGEALRLPRTTGVLRRAGSAPGATVHERA